MAHDSENVVHERMAEGYDPPSASMDPMAGMSRGFRLLGRWVRVYSNAVGCENDVMAEGEVIAYCKAPTVMVRSADGTKGSWSMNLRIVEIEPPTPPDPAEVAWAAIKADTAVLARLGTMASAINDPAMQRILGAATMAYRAGERSELVTAVVDFADSLWEQGVVYDANGYGPLGGGA